MAHHELVASAKAVIIGKTINPDFQIGCITSHVPIYPYSCDPADVKAVEEAMHQRFFFSDVHVRGYYPNYALKEFQREIFTIRMDPTNAEVLRQGTVVYVGFSHYMSTVVKEGVNN